MSVREFYHALDLACIDVLDCDLPLDIGFNILRYVRTVDRGWGGVANNRGMMWYHPRQGDIPVKKNLHTVSKNPLHMKSNSGAGYR